MRIIHLERLEDVTWFHSFEINRYEVFRTSFLFIWIWYYELLTKQYLNYWRAPRCIRGVKKPRRHHFLMSRNDNIIAKINKIKIPEENRRTVFVQFWSFFWNLFNCGTILAFQTIKLIFSNVSPILDTHDNPGGMSI